MAHSQFVNSPRSFVADAIRGLVAATDDLAWHPDPGYLTRRAPLTPGRVAVLSGGGSGHEPMHAGFIGRGMLAGACPGLVFTSPNALQIDAATRAVDAGAGVVHVVKNYTGDVLNFRIAADLAREHGVAVEHVLVADDVASDKGTDESGEAVGPGMRGTAATIAVEKVCGASAARGDELAAVAALGRRVADGARSMAVALRPCTLPGAEEPSFDLPEGQIEIGIGIHGERGTERRDAMRAHELVPLLADRVLDALPPADDDRLIAIVNGLGATHPLELQLLYGELHEHLAHRGLVVARAIVGSFTTALDMAGASITLIRCDDEILELWDADTDAPAWPNAPSRRVHTAGSAGAAAPPSGGGAAPGDESAGGASATDGPDVRPTGFGAVGEWLGAWAGRVIDEEPALTRLDRQAGDGDFGTNMVAALDTLDLDALRTASSPERAFTAVSDAYLGHAGGTSGALFGVWFRRLAGAAGATAGSGPAGFTVADLARGARSGLDAITALGGAQPGDKTMIDALDPAVRALEEGVGNASSPATVLSSAADAAARGAESTAGITARRGRASYIGEAARGVIDPGALVMAWLFEEAARAA
ncbi:dihydroxyacetone kinase family protein [Tomitella fengzijianii]|uniref:Dihydroxyacetone kinase family protein n=1 Tax=Tomitella fengzijianii TaxID=2597660 RepID=A0A516X332_9ACTN|nr:dihydroxyacetone kinase family protein [Tomitella fengzijianii]QDQ97480.1 dihydroxyacetone kinase family protein [Tomitella fengzijianii]